MIYSSLVPLHIKLFNVWNWVSEWEQSYNFPVFGSVSGFAFDGVTQYLFDNMIKCYVRTLTYKKTDFKNIEKQKSY